MKSIATWLIAAGGLLHSRDLWACATCFGAPDDPQTQGMNAAILTLLGVTYTLFLGMIAAAVVIWHKSRHTPATDSDEMNISASPEPRHG